MAKTLKNARKQQLKKHIVFISLSIIILICAIFVGTILFSSTDLAGMARNAMLPAYDETKLNIYGIGEKSTRNNKSVTRPLLSESFKVAIKFETAKAEKLWEIKKQMDDAKYCSDMKNASDEKQKNVPQKQPYSDKSATRQAEATPAKISSCVDPEGNDYKKASSVYSYYIQENPPEEKCLIERDHCKEDGLPYLYEAYCGADDLPKIFDVFDCSQFNKEYEYYVCIKGACIDVNPLNPPVCGNGIVEKDEQCDDSNEIEGDGCNNCIAEFCGDSIVQQALGEQCDDANEIIDDNCNKCLAGYCGDGILQKMIGEECDDGNVNAGDGCGPECKYEPVADLIIGNIASDAYSELCINFYVFEVCNVGEGPVSEDFKVKIEANEQESVFDIDVEENPLNPAECRLIKNPPKAHILKFTTLDSTDNVKFSVDIENKIIEKDNGNNEKSAEIYSGNNYYYEPGNFEESNVCNVWCYDTDEGKNYFTAGKVNFLYAGETYEDSDGCDTNSNYENKAILSEQFCVSPIYKLDNGLYVYPQSEKWVDCTLLDAKCEDNKCVPLEKESQLKCQDPEVDIDPFVKGTVDYTSIEGEKKKLEDKCENEYSLADYYCDSDELADIAYTNCVYLNAVCEGGKCVKVDKTNKCSDDDASNDPLVYGTAVFDMFNGFSDTFEDGCSYDRVYVSQSYCVDSTSPPKNEDYDCTQSSNEYGVALCVMGVCKFPDPSIMECNEMLDNGLDYYKKGSVSSTSMYDVKDYNQDTCLEGTNLLIEYYCAGDELKMAEPYDCSLEGLSCQNGRCVSSDPNLKKCEVADDEGDVYYTNEFGDEDYYGNHCIKNLFDLESWTKESNFLLKYSCNGNSLVSETVDCTKQGKMCFYGECLKKDESFKSCTPDVNEPDSKDPYIAGTITYTNDFNSQYDTADYCYNSFMNDMLEESFCNGNEKSEEEIDCAALGIGMKCYVDKCAMPNEELKQCTDYDEGDGEGYTVEYTNEFGYPDYVEDKCIDWDEAWSENEKKNAIYGYEWEITSNYRVNFICDGSSLAYELTDCSAQGMMCYDGTCLAGDDSNVGCHEEGQETDSKDPFTGGTSVETDYFNIPNYEDDYCKEEEGDMLKEYFCEDKEIESMWINCSEYGMKCDKESHACKKYDPSLISCTETDMGSDPNTPSYVQITDGFGNYDDGYEECHYYGEKVEEVVCVNNYPEQNAVKCASGKVCKSICKDGEYLGDACIDSNAELKECPPAEVEVEETSSVPDDENNNGGGGEGSN